MNIVQDIIRSFLSFSSDAIIIAVLAVIFTSYGIFFGKGKILALILALYPSAFLFDKIPYFKKVLSVTPVTVGDALSQLVIFLALFVPISYIFSQFIHSEFSFSRVKKVLSSAALGITATSLTILFSYHVINIQKVYNFSSGIDSLFIGNYVFWWLLAPFAIIYFFRR